MLLACISSEFFYRRAKRAKEQTKTLHTYLGIPTLSVRAKSSV